MLSVIIPTLNESAQIELLLEDLCFQSLDAIEILVVDGGSTDDTLDRVQAFSQANPGAEIRTFSTTAGRGHQQNVGAEAARQPMLLFLHADSRMTHSDQLEDAVRYLGTRGDRAAGHWPLQFETNSPGVSQTLAYFEAKSSLNRPGTFNGDQGLLIARATFQLMGGFSTRYGFMEDQDFGERFSLFGEFVTLPHVLRTSARRFTEEGVRERIILNSFIMAMYHLDEEDFFLAAPDIYRSQSRTRRLDLGPFMDLAQFTLFKGEFPDVARRLYRLGRYVTGNAWQIALWAGLKRHNYRQYLRTYDRWVDPLINNPLGYLICIVGVLTWFTAIRIRQKVT